MVEITCEKCQSFSGEACENIPVACPLRKKLQEIIDTHGEEESVARMLLNQFDAPRETD